MSGATRTARRGRGRPPGGGLSPEEARERILDAAEACFAERGVEGTTIDEVAARAGFSRASFYRHVSGRDDLIGGVAARYADRYIAVLAGSLDPDAPLEDLVVELMATVVELVGADPDLAVMFGAGQAVAGAAVGGSPEVRERARRFAAQALEQASDAQLAELRPGVSADDAADHLVLVGLALVQGYGPDPADDAAVRDYLRRFAVPPLVVDG